MSDLLGQLRHFDAQVEHYDRQIEQLARHSEPAQRLMSIEGIGPITATALVASVGKAIDICARCWYTAPARCCGSCRVRTMLVSARSGRSALAIAGVHISLTRSQR